MSALEKIEAAAQALLASGKVATREQGVLAALNANPKLYEMYLSENPSQHVGR